MFQTGNIGFKVETSHYELERNLKNDGGGIENQFFAQNFQSCTILQFQNSDLVVSNKFFSYE